MAENLTQTHAKAPCFSVSEGAWVMERPEDIRAVLWDARFGMPGETAPDPSNGLADQPYRWWSSADSDALLRPAPDVLRGLLARLEDFVRAFEARGASSAEASVKASAPDGMERPGASDLMMAVLRPWCREVAAELLALPIGVVQETEPLTRRIFDVAAQLEEQDPEAMGAAEATQRLLERLSPYRRADRPGDGLDIQAWVALTQTLPVLIGAGVLHLRRQESWDEYRNAHWDLPATDTAGCPFGEPGSEPAAGPSLSALLAAASPVRALFRTALQEVVVGNVVIARGARVMLKVAGNSRFLFGDGRHRCAGASLVRTLFVGAIAVFRRSDLLQIPDGVTENNAFTTQWADGRAMRALLSMEVPPYRSL